MKYPLLIGAILLLNVSASAQCKELKETKDAFSDHAERSAQVIIGNMRIKWSVDVYQSDGRNSMKWGIAMIGEFNQRFEEGTLMLLKLEDGTILKLKTSEASNPVTQAVSGGPGIVNVFTQYVLRFDLDKETLKKLANSPITDIKVDVPDQKIESPKVKDKQMEKLRSLFECMLEG